MAKRRGGYAAIGSRGSAEMRGPKRGLMDSVVSGTYGLVAAAMCAPVMMSFASIIFADPFFRPFYPLLVKLVLFSAAVHQVCFTCGSSMPFAVGQVQDAGLIFLSAIAHRVVDETKHHYEAETVVAVALCILAGATASLGVMLIVIGRFRLASLAQNLPVPVVGGYLAYIGFYCGQAGVAMMSGVELKSLGSWSGILTWHAMARIAPGVGVCAAMKVLGGYAARSGVSRSVRATIVPSVLAATIILFYAVQYGILGRTVDDARRNGWVGEVPVHKPAEKGLGGGWRNVEALRPWTLFVPASPQGRVDFCTALKHLVPKVLPSWVAMVAVVAFSSSLDVAAIEMEIGRPLDYDQELITVGVGNLVSGCTGGFSGSYIFSQTILNLRSGVADRLSGAVVAVFEFLLVFCFPVPPTALAPTCAFGGLLLLIAVELVTEWLVESRKKFSTPEYVCAVSTFVAIHVFGLEAGFAAGLVFALLIFATTYTNEGGISVDVSPVTQSVVMRDFDQRATLSAANRRGEIVSVELRGFVFFGAAAKLLVTMRELVLEEDGPPTQRWVIIHARNFAGVDATAVRACFLPLQQALKSRGSHMLFAALRPKIAATLRANGIELVPGVDAFKSHDGALEYAEEALLRACSQTDDVEAHAARVTPEDPTAPLRTILSDYLLVRDLTRANRSEYNLGRCDQASPPRGATTRSWSSALSPSMSESSTEGTLARSGAALERYFQRLAVDSNTAFFQAGESSDTLYFVEAGTVDLYLPDSRRIQHVKRGGIFGELNFSLCRRSRFSARAVTPCVCWTLRRAAADKMAATHPALFLLLQCALLKSISLQVEDSLLFHT
ncbi:hypothetical protein M885DRAFT_518906 [Pelagophyceae sp. CCMP2097]|nr:hypothetical protein M885DRAFT_518906 [Pelagophyceae sp. CCMP2097]|mmetsp:Transcript_8344/g.29341  ORF Transcript_8344/g.29341 Transcript_8344/m.29341 type:complete len:838 (-) Transcript_8344:36-2549(-)